MAKHIGKIAPRVYTSDFSQSNPALHELYVNTAMVHLKQVNEFLDTMWEHSNTNASDFATVVYQVRQSKIDNDAAYRDAAARLMAGHEPVDEDDSGWVSSDQPA